MPPKSRTCHTVGCSFERPKRHNVYNLYFQEQMKTKPIKRLPHKRRMTAVGKLWKVQKHLPQYANRPKAPPALKNCPKCKASFKRLKRAQLPTGAVEDSKAKKLLRKAAFKPTAYTTFFIGKVKDKSLAALTPKDRMRAIGKLWQAEKLKKAKQAKAQPPQTPKKAAPRAAIPVV
jgi:hypothetical protein